MGRKRIDINKKRVKLTITLPYELIQQLKSQNINISRTVEKLLNEHQNK
jgi:post-segregation antitoxin (ccd killing protein)